jgi:hypothetical protein
LQIEESHAVLDHTKLISRDNTFTPLEEIAKEGEEIAEADENKVYKAKMHLVLNDYYLKQKLSGYDIYKNQKNININDYRVKVAN